MLTGLHGCHVIVGVSLLSVCFPRLSRNHYLRNHYLGLISATRYRHFVDAIRISLFLVLHC